MSHVAYYDLAGHNDGFLGLNLRGFHCTLQNLVLSEGLAELFEFMSKHYQGLSGYIPLWEASFALSHGDSAFVKGTIC